MTYLELMTVFTGTAYSATLVATRGAGVLRAAVDVKSVAAGVGMFGAYVCVLAALKLAPAASVAAIRESGVLVATALAAVFLRERVSLWRAGGAALVVAGVALVSL